MRYANGELIGDSNDDVFATSSADIAQLNSLTDFNENETFYDLLPVVVNRPPVISGSIFLESDPDIRDIDLSDGSGEEMYVNRDGVIRVAKNTTITLRFKARQPSIANVENGVLQVIPNDNKIQYIWRKDDIAVNSSTIAAVRSVFSVRNNELTIERIQPRHSGVYVCDAVNDIGTTSSEAITIEVVDPYEDPLLYRNLVTNPYGKDGVLGWNSNNQNFTTRQFTNVSSVDLKTPHRVDLFGYNIDMMHPRPYQIDAGSIRGVDLYTDLTTDNGTFFSRTPYKYELTGDEPGYVSAYQDIDLTDLSDMIRGGVFGISGLRAVFGCYIGNAITSFIPTNDNAFIDARLRKSNYFSGAPRVSLENFLTAGPSMIREACYVTVEEFEDETRLISTLLGSDGQPVAYTDTITIKDPWDWSTLRRKYWGETRYYEDDIYLLNRTSKRYSSFDTDLFAADELLGPPEERFTFGQYIKFNKLVIDKLNPKTNKIRIGIHFSNSIPNLQSNYKRELDTGDPIDIPEWQRLHKKNTFDEEGWGYFQYINPNTPSSAPPRKRYTFLQTPRPLVTGLTLGLIPVVIGNVQRTDYETESAFSLNSSPTSYVPNVLTPRPFDPLNKLRRDITVRFGHRSTFGQSTLTGAETNGSGDLATQPDFYQDTTFIQSRLTIPSSQNSSPTLLTGSSFLPFELGVDTLYVVPEDTNLSSQIRKYGIDVSDLHSLTNSFPQNQLSVARNRVHNSLNQLGLINTLLSPSSNNATFNFANQRVATAAYGRGTTSPYDLDEVSVIKQQWNKKLKFICHYTRNRFPPPQINVGSNSVAQVQSNFDANSISDSGSIDGNSYYVELDLTDSNSPKSIIWRDETLIGAHGLSSSFFGPFEMETGYSIGNESVLYFKLPQEVTESSLDVGGLALSRQVPISISLSSSTYPVADGQALNALLSDPIGFRAIVQILGEEFGRTLIKNMWPDVSMFTAVPGNNNDSEFESTPAFNDYVEFHRRATYDYLTQVPSGSQSITVPYRFGPAPPNNVEQFVGGLFGDPDFNLSTNVDDRLFEDGSTTISVGVLLEQREGLYGQSGTRLYMRRGLLAYGALSKLFVCTPGEYNEAIASNREVIYTSPTFLQLQRLIGTSTDLQSNSFTISIDRSFSNQIADQQGFDNSQNQVSITGQPSNIYRRISLSPSIFVNATVDVLSVDFTTPSNVLVRNAASMLYAVETVPLSPSPLPGVQEITGSIDSLNPPTLFSAENTGTPVFALGPDRTYFHLRYSTIIDQQMWFGTSPQDIPSYDNLW